MMIARYRVSHGVVAQLVMYISVLSVNRSASGTFYRFNDSFQIFDVEKKARGSQLLELVMNHLELREKEYFGLMFNDTGGVLPSGHSPDVMRWLDPLKPVRKQMRTAISGVGARTLPTLYLRVKFYVNGRCL